MILSAAQVMNCVEAAYFAQEIGLPFNRFSTILWERAGVTNVGPAVQRYFKLIQDFVRSKGHRTAFIWALERGRRNGLHIHIMLHIPPELARLINNRQRGWLKKAGAERRKGVIKSRVIGLSLKACFRPDGGCYAKNHDKVLAYTLKNCDFEMRRFLGSYHSTRSGLIQGKRCGTSENIGRAARARC